MGHRSGEVAGEDGRTHRPGAVRRVVAASVFGSTLEYYDFFLYGTAAALVFPTVFFPTVDPVAATVLSFGTFAVGFISRPLGALVCGHYGDRVGRKRMLMFTLVVMGVATTLIGLLPGYATIGIAAPMALVVLRFLQGFSFGGELAGAGLMVVEHAPPQRRGVWGSLPFAGAPLGLAASTLLLLLLALVISTDEFIAWGWRIPFVASSVLVAIGFYIRLKIIETPVFEQLERAQAVSKVPVIDLIRREPRQLLLNTGMHLAITVTFYLVSVFAVSYMTTTLGMSKVTVLASVAIANLILVGALVFAGAASDRFGRRVVWAAAGVYGAIIAAPSFALINTESPVFVVIGLILLGAVPMMMYGTEPAYFSELFPPEIRYTGFALPVGVATVIGGSTAPIIATELTASMDGKPWGVAAYIAGVSLIGTVCALLSRETRGTGLLTDLHRERPHVRELTLSHAPAAPTPGSNTGA